MLLSDAKFAQATQDYVLAWQNLRPAPKVTIDFGNGRTLQRTLKGSTVIYLCRPDGSVVDAYPGVYTPQDFLGLLNQSRSHLHDSDQEILAWHRQPLAAAPAPPLTVSKAAMQGPLLNALSLPAPPEPAGSLSDLSQYPMTRPQVAVSVGLPPNASGRQLVEEDSRRYRDFARPAAHRLLAGWKALPQPTECALPMFKEVLHVPIDDPYLGLKDDDLPGTP